MMGPLLAFAPWRPALSARPMADTPLRGAPLSESESPPVARAGPTRKPRALSTTEYWRADLPLRGPLDPAASSSGDAHYT